MEDKSKNFEQSNFVIENLDDEWQYNEEIDWLRKNVDIKFNGCVKNICKHLMFVGISIAGKMVLDDMGNANVVEYENLVLELIDVLITFGVKFGYYSSILATIWYFIKFLNNFLDAHKISKQLGTLEKMKTEEENIYKPFHTGFDFDPEIMLDCFDDEEFLEEKTIQEIMAGFNFSPELLQDDEELKLDRVKK